MGRFKSLSLPSSLLWNQYLQSGTCPSLISPYLYKQMNIHTHPSNTLYIQVSNKCVCVLDDFTSTCINLEILSFQPENRHDFVFINSHRHFWKDRTLTAVSCATWWNLLKTGQQFLIATCQVAMSAAASVTGFHRVVFLFVCFCF